MNRPFALLPLVTLALSLTTACDGSNGPKRARPDQIPALVSVGRGTTTYGFLTSSERLPLEVGAFRVSKSPITVAQYKQCMEAGACSVPSENACLEREGAGALSAPTYDTEGAGDLPLTCAGIAQAEAYCAWVGGTLPTVAQWLTAVRGREVTRFAWGNRAPRCDYRPDLGPRSDSDHCLAAFDASFAVGHHPKAVSPFGVEDVLLAPGELIAPSHDSPLQPCSAPFAACVAYGTRPGAIDSAAPLGWTGAGSDERSPHAYAFRCVLPGESK